MNSDKFKDLSGFNPQRMGTVCLDDIDFVTIKENGALFEIIKHIQYACSDKDKFPRSIDADHQLSKYYPGLKSIFKKYEDIKFIIHCSTNLGLVIGKYTSIQSLNDFKSTDYWKMFETGDKMNSSVFKRDSVFENLYYPMYWYDFEEFNENDGFKNAIIKAVLGRR